MPPAVFQLPSAHTRARQGRKARQPLALRGRQTSPRMERCLPDRRHADVERGNADRGEVCQDLDVSLARVGHMGRDQDLLVPVIGVTARERFCHTHPFPMKIAMFYCIV